MSDRIAAIQSLIGAGRLAGAGVPNQPAAKTQPSFAELLAGQVSVADDATDVPGKSALDPLAALGLNRTPATTGYETARSGYAANATATTAFTLRTTRPDALPPVAVTAAMEAAGNGNLPDAMLVSIGRDGHRLSAPAAAAFRRLAADAERDGVTIGVSDSYRSYADQVDMANRVGLYGQGGLAAVPGTSNHGWGLSLDLSLDDRAQQWMRDNGWRYSFFEDVPNEPWHWTYRG